MSQGYHGAQAQHELFRAKARDWQLRIDSLGTELQALRNAPATTRATKEQQGFSVYSEMSLLTSSRISGMSKVLKIN